MAPIAREVRDYIAGHPSVSDALKMGIVNYSALARKISKELGIPVTITTRGALHPLMKDSIERDAIRVA